MPDLIRQPPKFLFDARKLRSYFPFDTGISPVEDVSGNATTFTIVDANVKPTAGIVWPRADGIRMGGLACTTPVSSNAVQLITNLFSSNTLSIALWLYPNLVNSFQ